MCTVSIIAIDGGYRLVSNRDEQRRRPSAEYPYRWGRRGIGPFDPGGGGTWIAARPGLTLCILNYNLVPKPKAPPRAISRGRIIPAMIDRADAAAAIGGLAELDLARFAPFRLIAVSRGDDGAVSIAEGRWQGSALEAVEHARLPMVFVSSGLGDAVVRPRLGLFEQMVCGDPVRAMQDAFHQHRWAERLEVSVLMARPDARTVSMTEVEDTAGGLAVRYWPVTEEGELEEAVLHEAGGCGEVLEPPA